MRLLDLFAGSGGCADGYAAAGFDVVGVDTDAGALRHYPHPSVRADAMDVLADLAYLSSFDVVHASPPCQGYSRTRSLARAQGRERVAYPDLLAPVLAHLAAWGGVWVVENVPGAPLPGAVLYCGRAFGLAVKRHRLFAASVLLLSPGCACGTARPVGVYGRPGDHVPQGGTTARDLGHGLAAMGMSPGRMPWPRLTQAIPPAYTEHVGAQLLQVVAA